MMNSKYKMLRAYSTDIEKLKELKFDFRVNNLTDALSELIKEYKKLKEK